MLTRAWIALAAMVVVASPAPSAEAAQAEVYRVGSSKVDITGPVAHVNMMGYADAMQRATGLLNRLYARAYVVERDPPGGGSTERIAVVHCDLHSIPLQLHQVVVERLESEFGSETFSSDNVMIHGQHTHSGPGGLHTFYLYYLSTLGFTQIHFDMVADQLVAAVKAAAAAMAPRELHISHTDIHNCSAQRSMEAYMQNPREERERHGSPTNTRMTIVKMTPPGAPHQLEAVWTFFAVHTTSLQGSSTMISSDNKGYAAWLLEKTYGPAGPGGRPGFSAAFFQTEAGDVSPNVVDRGDGTFTGVHGDDFVRNAEHVGKCQADAARAKLDSPSTNWVPVSGSLFSRKVFFDFSSYVVPGVGTTCPAVSGVNMVAGTEDGRGLPFIFEGALRGNAFVEFLGKSVLVRTSVPKEVEACHYPKVSLFATGLTNPPATPQVLPIQLLAIGNLAMVAVPFEVTTMAGRRIAETVFSVMGDRPLDHVAVAAVSNAYAGYLATREEYMVQHYEGACTHFGPNQLQALQHMLSTVYDEGGVKDTKQAATTQPEPVLSLDPQHVLTAVGSTLLDEYRPPPFHELGDLVSDAAAEGGAEQPWKRGEVVAARFWCARPMNSQLLVGSFCDVEQLDQGGKTWAPVLRDDDWNVRFRYHSRWLLFGVCTCQWVLPTDDAQATLPPGSRSFRLRLRGLARAGGQNRFYEGVSSPFRVSDEVALTVHNLATEYMYGVPEEILLGLAALALAYLVTRFAKWLASRLASQPARKTKSV